jgi:integrase
LFVGELRARRRVSVDFSFGSAAERGETYLIPLGFHRKEPMMALDVRYARLDTTREQLGELVDALSRRGRRIRLHDLRHTHASLALAAGVHRKVVQERLGHASIAITLDTYSHVAPVLQEEAAAKVAALLAR